MLSARITTCNARPVRALRQPRIRGAHTRRGAAGPTPLRARGLPPQELRLRLGSRAVGFCFSVSLAFQAAPSPAETRAVYASGSPGGAFSPTPGARLAVFTRLVVNPFLPQAAHPSMGRKGAAFLTRPVETVFPGPLL